MAPKSVTKTMRDFSMQLTKIRHEQGLLPNEVADAAPLTNEYYNRMEDGDNDVVIYQMQKVAEVLNMHLEIKLVPKTEDNTSAK